MSPYNTVTVIALAAIALVVGFAIGWLTGTYPRDDDE